MKQNNTSPLSQALFRFQLGKRQEGGASKFQWKEKVDNS